MFDLDLSKMLLFGAVALVVVKPSELPAALRTAGRALSQLRRLRSQVRTAADKLMADADLGSVEREIGRLDETLRVNIARNPATAMRGSLPRSGASPASDRVAEEALAYASPEMQAYLATPVEEPTHAAAEVATT